MSRMQLDTRIRVNLFLMAFENVNMYAKGHYRIKLEGMLNGEKCDIKALSKVNRESELGKKEGESYFSKEFAVRYQSIGKII
jgi:hypothetical protein